MAARRQTVNPIARAARLAAIAAALLTGPAGASTVYERLGAAPGVAAIADRLIDEVAHDPVLGRSFKDAKLARIKQHLAEQLCELSGGPCRYDGDTMREVHAGHDISEGEFYGMVNRLTRILRERGVSLADRNFLLARLAPLKRDVVRVPAGGS